MQQIQCSGSLSGPAQTIVAEPPWGTRDRGPDQYVIDRARLADYERCARLKQVRFELAAVPVDSRVGACPVCRMPSRSGGARDLYRPSPIRAGPAWQFSCGATCYVEFSYRSGIQASISPRPSWLRSAGAANRSGAGCLDQLSRSAAYRTSIYMMARSAGCINKTPRSSGAFLMRQKAEDAVRRLTHCRWSLQAGDAARSPASRGS